MTKTTLEELNSRIRKANSSLKKAGDPNIPFKGPIAPEVPRHREPLRTTKTTRHYSGSSDSLSTVVKETLSPEMWEKIPANVQEHLAGFFVETEREPGYYDDGYYHVVVSSTLTVDNPKAKKEADRIQKEQEAYEKQLEAYVLKLEAFTKDRTAMNEAKERATYLRLAKKYGNEGK